MIEITKVQVFNWEAAIRGMRNPLNSWDKSDSEWEFVEDPSIINPHDEVKFVLGPNDLALAKRLISSGSDHRKFMRQIFVSMDINAPLYWWKEFDTYKVGTTANSCSTMHTIHKKEFELDDFSHDHLLPDALGHLMVTIDLLNWYRNRYYECTMSKYGSAEACESAKKSYWYSMIQTLPSSYNQKRTVTLTYENFVNMYRARRNHKLAEWHTFCDTIRDLPYSELITGEGTQP